MTFGKQININPKHLTKDLLRDLLTRYGVIAFDGYRLTQPDQTAIMSNLGILQDGLQQQAPTSNISQNNKFMVNLYNDDFLGEGRMNWHTDQTYLQSPYLPIRSLYSPVIPSPGNVTSFLDINHISDLILSAYPEIEDKEAKYLTGGDSSNFCIRPMFSYCEHTKRKMFRLDARMRIIDQSIDKSRLEKIILDGIQSAPKFNVTWKQFTFVIFDNNRCPHRRSSMAGNCHLQRYTTNFWLECTNDF